MAHGFQIFKPDGSLHMDLSKRTARYLGYFSSGTSAGSMTDSRITGGIPYFVLVSDTTALFGAFLPQVTMNQSTGVISWTFQSGGTARSATIIYGII